MTTLLTANTNSLIVIDSRVTDWKALMVDINPTATILVLDPLRDGLTQIADAVANYSYIDAIHIISHGNAGSLLLGSSTLDSGNLNNFTEQLTTIGNALSSNGDILLYGCDVAQGDVGQQFIGQLSQLTAADVAASTNLTGAINLGGDWVLESATGLIEASALNATHYADVLVAPIISNLDPTVSFTEGGVAKLIDSNITFTGGYSYGGGYVRYSLANSNSADQLTLTSAVNPTAAGAISISGNSVYLGNGTGMDSIGSVDAIENGVNGQALKINFLSYFVNPGFELDPLGVNGSVSGWTLVNQQVKLGITTIAGYITPVDTLLPSPIGSNISTPTDTNPLTTYYAYEVAAQGSDSPNSGGTGGNQSLRLYNHSEGTNAGFDVLNGSYAVSSAFGAMAGDVLYFDWRAASGKDAYDAFAYLLNVADGTTIAVINETGQNQTITTPWATKSVTIPTTGNYEFVFVTGSWDETGHKFLGGSLYIDNFKVYSNNANDNIAQTIAQQMAYQNTATDAPVSRILTMTVADGDGITNTATTNLVINLINNQPSFSAGATLPATTEDTPNPAGATISTLLNGQYTDPDNVYTPTDTLAGIAIVNDGSLITQGSWQYSTDSGSTWNAVGNVSTSAALLLSSSTLLRFLPAPDYNGTPGNLSVHAVDSSGGLVFTNGATHATFDTTTDGATSPASVSSVTIDTSVIAATSNAPVLNAPTAINYIDSPFVDNFAPQTGVFSATDINVGTTFTYSIIGGVVNGTTVSKSNAYGTLTVIMATGEYSFIANGTAIEPLGVNSSDSTIVISVSDGLLNDSGYFNVSVTQNGVTETVGNDILTGTANNDIFNALAGDDIINGWTGADIMTGGTGNDAYIVDNAGDWVAENLNEGIDSVYSSISYTLTSDVEQLILIGTAADATGNTLNNYIVGTDADNSLNGWNGADTLRAGLGNDVYVVDNAGDWVIENVNEGIDTVYSNVSYTLTDNVEKLALVGTAAINGSGNTLDNYIAGDVNDNILNGWTGADVMIGGAGNDAYIVDNAGDWVAEKANEGMDIVYSSISYELTSDVEQLVLIGTATDAVGNALDNYIGGNSANNNLNGWMGADTMRGGAGDDIYTVDNAGDWIIENTAEGVDIVSSSVSYALTENIEQLVIIGIATTAVGNILDNILTGNNNDNTLNGWTGADIMIGGAGNDAYVVDNAGDWVAENVNEGIDTVYSSISYVLTANLESIALIGTAISGTGNELDNYIVGNGSDNMLNGWTGADIMIGGAGNDAYIVDNVGDWVAENANEGVDTVYSSISYALTNNVEQLALVGTAADAAGNTLDNYIQGDGVNNTINGWTGADTMMGGAGDDTYIVDNAGDWVAEKVNEGIDSVNSSVSYALTDHVENLILTGISAIDGQGNLLNNYLIGNNAANYFYGGDGADTYIGGFGADNYDLADNAIGSTSTDSVRIAAGESLVTGYDKIINYQLATGVNSAGVDQLDLDSTLIAANTVADGINMGSISSHSINNGIISFGALDQYDTPIAITAANLSNALDYLQANITDGNTAAFVSEGNTYLFQDGGVLDTVVELIAITASSINSTALTAGSIWIV